MVKNITVNDLRKRITLCKTVNRFDGEQNLIRQVVPMKTVWAKVEEKRAAINETQAGQKPVITYLFTIRKTDVSEVKTVMYNGKTLEMYTPLYTDNPAFIQFEAGETDGTVIS